MASTPKDVETDGAEVQQVVVERLIALLLKEAEGLPPERQQTLLHLGGAIVPSLVAAHSVLFHIGGTHPVKTAVECGWRGRSGLAGGQPWGDFSGFAGVAVDFVSNDAGGHLVEVVHQRGVQLLELRPQHLIDEALRDPQHDGR